MISFSLNGSYVPPGPDNGGSSVLWIVFLVIILVLVVVLMVVAVKKCRPKEQMSELDAESLIEKNQPLTLNRESTQ